MKMQLENTFLQRKLLKKNKMRLGEEESFVFKHPYFFENFKFRFVGYKPKLQQALEDIVKEHNIKYYSINYIAHCIAAEEPLNTEPYKFIELEENSVHFDCSCLDIRNILKAKFCHLDNFDNVKCTLCMQSDIMVLDNLSSESMNSSNNLPNEENTSTNVRHESCNAVEVVYHDASETTENNQQDGAGVLKWKSKQQIDVASLDDSSDDELKSPSRKIRKVGGASTTKNNTISEIEVITIDSNDQALLSRLQNIAVIKENLKRKDWWLYLPPGIHPNQKYKEPEFVDGLFPERDYSFNEKRTMIAYLVINNLIENFDKRSTWRKMHCDGHLRQRSIHSLKAQIKIILSKIEFFQLPPNIKERFLKLKT